MKNQHFPIIHFSFDSPRGARPFDERLLDTPLPLARPTSDQTAPEKITYRVYLKGIEAVILQHWDQFTEAVSEQAGRPVNDIHQIEVVAEKHGSDYHPARIRVNADGCIVCLVANVAVTQRGKERLDNDYHLLSRFRLQFQNRFVPRTYFHAQQTVFDIAGKETDLVMFLGEWLEGHHEFHLSRNPDRDTLETVIWDLDRGYRFLSEAQSREIYRRAAFILTYYYDVETFCEVFPWHHASGDFVVRPVEDSLEVKLITVRQYEPRTLFDENAPENLLSALLIFFANLTVRMRLDRFDGVGDVAWAGDDCVGATIQGFMDGMKEKVSQGYCSQQVSEDMLRKWEAMSPVEWAELFQFVVESYNQSAPDMPVIMENLVDHVFLVYSYIQGRAG
jgi:hypothetical protein